MRLLPLSTVSQRKAILSFGSGVGGEKEGQRQSAWHSGKRGRWAGHQQAGFQDWCPKPAVGQSDPMSGHGFHSLQDDEVQ